jgi:predicted Holliday junction resolvase-like endonuclease
MEIVDELKIAHGLYIDCPSCGAAMALRNALIFDASKKLPPSAAAVIQDRRARLEEELFTVQRERKVLAARAFRGAASGRVGKRLEMLAASLPGLPVSAQDCRSLGDPIDYLAFEGASRGSIDAVRFIEVKSTKAALSPVQREIRGAIERGKVTLNVADHLLCLDDANE